MTTLLAFITYIAWPVCVGCSVLFLMTCWNWLGEDSRTKLYRVARGDEFPFVKWGGLTMISALWLLAYYNTI